MPFQCDICGKGYTSKFNYNYHYAHHFDARPFSCEFAGCSSAYKTKADLRQHEKSHEKALGIKFACSECENVFDSSTKLNVHKRDFHTFKEASKWCEVCNKTFSNLRNHWQTVHENIRRFYCDLDGKKFARMAGLVRHIESVHLKLSPFPCNQCDKHFKEASALKKHVKVHEKFFQGQRFKKKIVNPEECSEDEEIALKTVRFKCGSCSRSYSTKEQMLKHQASAHADLPYSCDICGQGFASKQRTLTHIRTHQDCNRTEQFMAVRKLYKCGACKQLISTKSALERHKNNVHFDIYDFMCEICSARFRDRSSLNKHHIKHHSKTVNTSLWRFSKQPDRLQQDSSENHEATYMSVPLASKQEAAESSEIIIEMTDMMETDIKVEHEVFETSVQLQEQQEMKQEVAHREFIQCKLCPLISETTEDFKNHFVAKHVRLQNVSFSAAKKLDKPVIIKSLDSGHQQESCMKQEPSAEEELIEECGSDDYESVEALESICECSEGEPEDVDEDELLLMMQGETFNASTSSFDCKICSSTFEKLDLLKLHCTETHRIRTFKCKQCNQSFDTKEEIQSHWRMFHSKGGLFKDSYIMRDMSLPSKSLTCQLCSKALSSRMSLKRHIQLVHSNERPELFCDQCGDLFKDIRALKKHIIKGHTYRDILDISKPTITRRRKTTKRLSCEDCGEEVYGQLGLAQHWWNAHQNIKIVDKTRYHCLICRQVMNTRTTAMRHHRDVHQDGKILVRTCQVCELDFQLYQDFKFHVNLYHVGGNVCLVCGLGFETSLDLFNHSKIHRAIPENEKKLACDLCGFRAQQKVTIETHMANNHGALRKVYPGNTCEYCGVFFKCYQSFYTHIKNSHPKSAKDSEKFTCKFCGKTYKNSRDWRNHELLHSDPEAKQFQCDYEGCGRKYSSYCSFKGHVKYAHEVSRNQCRLCKVDFQSRTKLISHMEQVHPETRKFSCDSCGKSFRSQITQQRHSKLCAHE